MAKFIFSKNYNKQLEHIENYIFDSTENIESINEFLDQHDKVLLFIEQNPKTAAVHPTTGDQSWPFGNGRYRVFFKCVFNQSDLAVHLTDIIDNKELNQSIYPDNSIPTYDEE